VLIIRIDLLLISTRPLCAWGLKQVGGSLGTLLFLYCVQVGCIQFGLVGIGSFDGVVRFLLCCLLLLELIVEV
jgi:hypothetical protein